MNKLRKPGTIFHNSFTKLSVTALKYSTFYRLDMNTDKNDVKLLITKKDAKVGDRFNTVPDPELFIKDPDAKQWEIVELTDKKFSAVTKDDCIYVKCKYIGGPQE